MKRIISVSRRTDVSAFYGEWFMGRVKEGFAGVVNPFGGRRYVVSLQPEDVVCFVFWSKIFTPFLENLRIIDGLGYKFGVAWSPDDSKVVVSIDGGLGKLARTAGIWPMDSSTGSDRARLFSGAASCVEWWANPYGVVR